MDTNYDNTVEEPESFHKRLWDNEIEIWDRFGIVVGVDACKHRQNNQKIVRGPYPTGHDT